MYVVFGFYIIYFLGTFIYSIIGIRWALDSNCMNTNYGAITLFCLIFHFILLAFLFFSILITIILKYKSDKKQILPERLLVTQSQDRSQISLKTDNNKSLEEIKNCRMETNKKIKSNENDLEEKQNSEDNNEIKLDNDKNMRVKLNCED